jgi:hypothetical protein
VFETDDSVGLGKIFKQGGSLASLEFQYRDAVNKSVLFGEIVEVVGLAGDHNGDGRVDAADYVVWRKTDGSNVQGYNDWRSHYGQPAGSGSVLASVPEPAALVALILGGLGTQLVSTRRRGTN